MICKSLADARIKAKAAAKSSGVLWLAVRDIAGAYHVITTDAQPPVAIDRIIAIHRPPVIRRRKSRSKAHAQA